MSGFKFNPYNNKLNYNFLLTNIKYKFSIKEKAAWHLNEMYSFYLDKNFHELNIKLEKFYSGGLDSSYRILYFRKIMLMIFLQKTIYKTLTHFLLLI